MQKGGQDLSQGVNPSLCHVLCAWTHMEDWNQFRAGVDGQPEPQHLLSAAQPGAPFIQLQMREPEMAEEALVSGLRVLKSASQKGW
jgi:hypothetical protein